MKHIPNTLSALRIALIPVFVWQMTAGNTFNAALILAVSGLTDLLDGFLARRFGWVSQLGKVLDPAADKLTQVTVCVMLAVSRSFLWPFCMVLLAKEAVMLILGGHLISRGVKLDGAKWFGKLTTVLFYTSTTLIILLPQLPVAVIYAMLTATVISAIASALMYIPDYKRYLSMKRERTGAELPKAESGV